MLHRPLLTSIPTSTSTSRPPALQPAQPPSGSLPPHHHDHSHGLRSSSSAPVRPPAMKLQFINTAHPRDSTSAKRISQIRSHVAKDSHARRRQRRAANGSNRSSSACACACACSCSCVCPTASSTAAHAPAAAPTESPARSESPDSTSAETETQRLTSLPLQVLDWVLTYGYEICFPRDEVPRVMSRMRTTYVPFAIKHPCLLACIFYISYHRRYLNTDDPGEAARCHLLMQHYRLACIEMMKSALAVEEKPSAQTITLAMQLCSEAFFEGNPDVSFTHAYAARTMVSARGGLESFDRAGVDALISFLLATSVYSGNYWFVPGCAKFNDE
ncbi:uncharacterized protein TRIREDRAFT_102414 [Trichoderma reesei QM6a]|uniref:Predicted protein n=1 Tax=Hypocrea jecorina (strain QM6a) TaxID=431241 RepID=G0R968_HYPJQ|nr:uncharacterized protein TRIREDRAFT_102414 [Trichoderma reesei QM6a]EGR52649.1 predicted protein [Trichoderma reesei QM6a]